MAVSARHLILDTIPGVGEAVDHKTRVVGYGDAPGYSGLICTIILSKAGVKIGLVGSADWPNPHGLLEGTGKRHRYVACTSRGDVQRPGVKKLLEFAASRRISGSR